MMNIKDLPFKPLCTEAEIELGKKWLVDNKGDFSFTANYAVVSGNTVEPYKKQACHKQISLCPLQNRSVVATECGWDRRGLASNLTLDIILPFFTWLTQESYVARFILWSDPSVGFIVSADIPAPLLQNIMITTRHFVEVNEEAFKQFNKMLEEGVRGDLAYYVCFNSGYSTPHAKLNAAARTYIGHRALPMNTLNTLKNFLLGELGDTQKDNWWLSNANHYRVSTSYSGGWRFFSEGKDVRPMTNTTDPTFINCLFTGDEDFRNALSEYRKGKNGGIYKPPNPFDASARVIDAPKAGECSYEELFNFVVPYLQAATFRDILSTETIDHKEAA